MRRLPHAKPTVTSAPAQWLFTAGNPLPGHRAGPRCRARAIGEIPPQQRAAHAFAAMAKEFPDMADQGHKTCIGLVGMDIHQ
jgi:hypothetical protein